MGRVRSRNHLYKPKATRSGTKVVIPNDRFWWLNAQCGKVNAALSAADSTTTDPQLWKKADSLLAEFSSVCPQIMLAAEIAKEIRHLSALLPQLWDITAEHATSHDEARSAGFHASDILWLRIGCLQMSGQFKTALLLESSLTLETKTESDDFFDWSLRLFYSQQFVDAKCIFEKLQNCTGILCALFIGDFHVAKILMESHVPIQE